MGRILRLLGITLIATTIASMIGALVVRRRYTSSGTAGSDEVNVVAIFKPEVLVSHASAFRGGTAIVWMGSMDLDLRGATLAPEGAHLFLKIVQGGGRIFVPEDWRVQLKLLPILGGAADTRESKERSADAPTLTIEGFAIMGGFAIMSQRGASEAEPVPTFPEEAEPTVEAPLGIDTTGAATEAEAADQRLAEADQEELPAPSMA